MLIIEKYFQPFEPIELIEPFERIKPLKPLKLLKLHKPLTHSFVKNLSTLKKSFLINYAEK